MILSLGNGIPLIAGLIVLLVGAVNPREESRYAVPLGLIGLGGITVAGLLISNVTGVILVVICVALILALALTPAPEAARAAGRRYLTWMAIASSMLLFSTALDRLNASDPMLNLAGAVAALFIIGVGILLAAPPFSLWLPALAEEAPGVAALMVGLLGCGVAVICGEMAAASPWRLIGATGPAGLAGMGGVFAVIGALAAFGEKRPGRSFAHLIGVSAALILAYFTASPPDAPLIPVFALGVHALAAALGLAALASARGHFVGLFWQRPGTAIALIVSVLCLIGLPLTAGFVGRTLLAQAMREASPVLFASSALAGLLGGLAFLRSFEPIFHRTEAAPLPPRFADLIAIGLAVALLLRGIVPGSLLTLVR